MSDINVVCFYWVGDRWAEDSKGPEYVNKLYRGINRNLSIPFKFTCFTNESIGCQLDEGIHVSSLSFPSFRGTGVLPRLFMFSKDSGLDHGKLVLVLDLDIIVVGSLDEMASYDGDFIVRSKFAPGQQWKADGDIIGFRPSPWFERIFWKGFLGDYRNALMRTGGRERYWFRHVIASYFEGSDCDRWDRLYPGQVISYKRHVKSNGGRLPKNARIVSCHGNPRPHKIPHLWAKNNWR
jgi:hypothetical protein